MKALTVVKALADLLAILILVFSCCFTRDLRADERPPFTDYCGRLEQEIQGRKHGFLAGNVSYYIGGFHASWKLVEDETIGLTHPFHHDLRSRGVGLLKSKIDGNENTGIGNDYGGWEFYKDTRVLYGSVIVNGNRIMHPKPTSMRWRPDKLICEYDLDGVQIREEKFVGENDAIASLIVSSKPVTLNFSGHSFYHRNSVSSNAKMRIDNSSNSLLITEGGNVKSRPDPNADERVGPCVYTDMTTALSASRSIENVSIERDDRGVQNYEFSVNCDEAGTVVAWAMHDNSKIAMESAREIIRNHDHWRVAKTAEINRQLNEEVPFFRCPDEKFVDIYYYLWSLYLMYYIDVGKGWETENHTQTAVNNFLGMHRYDAMFQIKVGAWLADKPRYAYGNVLTWKHLTKNNRYREVPNGLRMISDNKGISWHSGAYGGETSEHVLGAWQIYQHTGDLGFLKICYEDHFAKLFWNGITVFAMNEFQVAETLQKMAALTGHDSDVERWKTLVRRDKKHVRQMFEQRWEKNSVTNYFAAPENGMLTTNSFWAMRSPYFPKEYAKRMVNAWALDKENGFYGQFFPLAMSRQSMRTFKTTVDHSFGYTPDTAYFTLDGMFRQELHETAAELTLNHIANYNFHDEWQIPIAPEAYRRDLSLFGDQYSNFNAGKILLFLEGLGGLQYSVPEGRLIVRPSLPKTWQWMEIRLPIEGQWTKIRYAQDLDRATDRERVHVTGCPLRDSRDGNAN